MTLPQPKPRPHARPRGLKDQARFLKSWIEKPLVIGAVSPSGRALARTMASYVDPAVSGPIVEIGPGTGPVTAALLARGIAPERLVLVEYSAEFVELLRHRFPGVTVVQGDAYRLAATLDGALKEPAAAVVSSLPLFTRPPADRARLLEQAFTLSRVEAPFIQFTYALVPPIPPRSTAWTAERSGRIWLNVPPARVWVYRRQMS